MPADVPSTDNPAVASSDDGCRPVESARNAAAVSAPRRVVLNRRVRLLVAATISYNVIEGVVAIAAGTVAGSTALVGFGLDSAVEVSSAAIVAWQFSARDPETRESTALRVIVFSFFGLAAYVSVDSIRALVGGHEADPSTIGIVLAAMSLVIMPFLSYAQRHTGRELGSLSAVADSRQTLLCTYLSAVLLVGLVVNSTLGWSWADPIAGLIIAAIALEEGRTRAWRPLLRAASGRDESDDEMIRLDRGSPRSCSRARCVDLVCAASQSTASSQSRSQRTSGDRASRRITSGSTTNDMGGVGLRWRRWRRAAVARRGGPWSEAASSWRSTKLVLATRMNPWSSNVRASGSSSDGTSPRSMAATTSWRTSPVNRIWKAATRSLTGPGRVPISRAATAKKHPPGNVRRRR